MKKLISLILSVAFIVGMVAGCGTGSKETGKGIKAGFIFLHDEKSTYDKNFLEAAKAACEELDVEYVLKTNIPEGKECYDAAADLVDQGCDVVFADSFGHEEWMIKAAKEFTDVQFCHATGTKAHTEKLDNYHNAFASIYEGRYLAGIAAGMKLNEMIKSGTITADKAVMGYVGAFPYAEVISGYSSFYLGAKSVCESATMKVNFTNSWYSVDDERNIANALMDSGCVLISQHADSMGAPSACEARNVPNISYNGSTIAECPNTFIVSSRIDWTPYFKYMIDCIESEKAIKDDYVGDLSTGSVVLTDVNTKAAAEGTQAAIDAAKKNLEDGTVKVFDTTKFTSEGKALTTYTADVDDMGDFVPDTEVISDGYFHESEYRSAPYFDISVDGITRLDKAN